ncbi:MAG: type II toxin-antitoxin system PemK/MazF family toxin [Anaerolineae bacterium]|nr:type II toxin-antitoxin system PemK/MazF family toxin [Anaerolineae bacterium]
MPFPTHIRVVDFEFYRYPRWGDVYWYDFGMPRAQQHTMAEPHLAVVISDTKVTLKGTALITPLSGAEHRKEGYDFHVLITRSECPELDKDSIVKIDQVYCVPVRPGLPDQYHLTQLDKKIMVRIYEPLLEVLGFRYVLRRSRR